jgi:hypothetical protein
MGAKRHGSAVRRRRLRSRAEVRKQAFQLARK